MIKILIAAFALLITVSLMLAGGDHAATKPVAYLGMQAKVTLATALVNKAAVVPPYRLTSSIFTPGPLSGKAFVGACTDVLLEIPAIGTVVPAYRTHTTIAASCAGGSDEVWLVIDGEGEQLKGLATENDSNAVGPWSAFGINPNREATITTSDGRYLIINIDTTTTLNNSRY